MSDVLLVNPPFLDPTLPPHFAAYLSGAVKDAGLDCSISFLDLNLELLLSICNKDHFDEFSARIARAVDLLEHRTHISRIDQLRVRCFHKFAGLTHEAICESLHTFRDESEFYNFARYQAAVTTLRRYVDAVSALGIPKLFSFWDSNHSLFADISFVDDICDVNLRNALLSVFLEPLQEIVRKCMQNQPRLIGVSCNYESQIIFASLLVPYLQAGAPNAILCIGGTEITSIYKSIRNVDQLWSLFPKNTIMVIGEGESAFVSIVRSLESDSQPKHDNIVTYSENHEKIRSAAIEDINAIGSPDYDLYAMDRYLSPEPVLMYSPTRGCYWNKCTFCDYGLNFGMPTSPSRQRSRPKVIEDLRNIARHSNVLYFAVDAIAPSYLARLAEAIVEAELTLSWSAEIRLERTISVRELTTKLTRGGCIALSFGFESASQRILDGINKGVSIGDVPSLIEDLTDGGVKVQLMGFFGFPGETCEDAETTLSFLREQRENFTTVGMGNFILTPGAIVAKMPNQFGVADLSDDGADIPRRLSWRDTLGTKRDGSENAQYVKLTSQEFPFSPLTRPFVGGIDTAHTLLYFRRFPEITALRAELAKQRGTIGAQQKIASSYSNILEFFDIEDARPMMKNMRVNDVLQFLAHEDRVTASTPTNYIVTDLGDMFLDVRAPGWIKQTYL